MDTQQEVKLDVKYLYALSQKDSLIIVSELISHKAEFEDLLKKSLTPYAIVLIIKILAKICQANYNFNVAYILVKACFIGFVNQIETCVSSSEDKNSKSYEAITKITNVTAFVNNTMLFCATVKKHFPKTFSTVLENLECICTAAMNGELLCSLFDKCLQIQNAANESSRLRAKENVKCELPPKNFREIEIFPALEEILSKESVFIRPNKVKGSYKNIEHYLDIHFRLLREDVIQPLREGMYAFMDRGLLQSDGEAKVKSNVWFFQGARFLHPRVVNFKIGYEVFFDPKGTQRNVQWETTKRLIFGSLLLFTCNNFKSIIIGVVIERKPSDIKRGVIVVELHGTVDPKVLNHKFVMVETSVHFESYRHALAALQNMNVRKFPMESYIVKVQCEVKPPKYLLRKLVQVYQINGFDVRVLDFPSWPSARQLEIDVSQYKALQSALTKEFVVIQGPPGTGKTFLASRVAEALLENVTEFPILVICYTNHALDQFLEELLQYTTDLIRVGMQSQSDALEKYNLSEKKRRKRATNHIISDFRKCVMALKDVQMHLKAVDGNQGIVSLEMLSEYNVINNTHYKHLKRYKRNKYHVANWLYDGNEHIEYQAIQKHYTDRLKNMLCPKYYDLSFEETEKKITATKKDLKHASVHMAKELNREINALQQIVTYFRQKLSEHVNVDDASDFKTTSSDLWKLSCAEKWKMYSSWIKQLKQALEVKLKEQLHYYQTEWETFNNERQIEDIAILSTCKVIGMTTTRAARDQSLLQKLKPKIVIVEEAAEVLESNIVASLTSHCEHLILIGDHKQLRPTPAVHELAVRFRMDISLFERMVRNGINCDQLQFQHRMRPEIAALIAPAIYPALKNHRSVLEYEDVVGVARNLYFVNHAYQEEQVAGTSYHNVHEAKFLIALCNHFLLQGYSSSEITILTTYSGQVALFDKLRNDDATLEQVCMTTVDNYQGEQNDIILLSLVRSNERGIVGFLKTENRVCVALSRARKGLYIIGNMDILAKEKSIWEKVNNTLQVQDAIGTHLPLKCQKHPSDLILVARAEDFEAKSPKGGCIITCNRKLRCGHRCKSVCHMKSTKHERPECTKDCYDDVAQSNCK